MALKALLDEILGDLSISVHRCSDLKPSEAQMGLADNEASTSPQSHVSLFVLTTCPKQVFAHPIPRMQGMLTTSAASVEVTVEV